MHFLPKSQDGWLRLLFFPFRAFVILVSLGTSTVEVLMPRHSDMGWGVFFVMIGNFVCGLVFLVGVIHGLYIRRFDEATIHLVFLLLAIVFGCHSMHYLSTA